MNLFPLIVSWAVLAVIVLALAVYRKLIAAKEDDMLHVRDSEVQLVASQASIANKLEVIDRWGKILTAGALLYGLALAALYVYMDWQESSSRLIRQVGV
jgi:hypothetical protein